MRVFLSAGEPSGDRWGAALAIALRRADPRMEIVGITGDKMREAGVRDIRPNTAPRADGVMGFAQPIRAYRILRDTLAAIAVSWKTERPDVVVTIDYPGFHMRLLKRAKEHGIRTVYYIPPQVWAWRQKRARDVAAVSDSVITAFEFERPYFTRWMPSDRVAWVGHPLADSMPEVRESRKEKHRRIALLPGSRRSEVTRLAPVMAEAVQRAGVGEPVFALHADEAVDWLPACVSGIPYVIDDTRGAFASADAAIVCAGSATLEAACAGVPTVICYRTDSLTYAIARMLVKTPWIGLPNVLLNGSHYPELIQKDATETSITDALRAVLDEPTDVWLKRAEALRGICGQPGVADRVAALVLENADGARV
jgi:lipid-A-disaccharide synthase